MEAMTTGRVPVNPQPSLWLNGEREDEMDTNIKAMNKTQAEQRLACLVGWHGETPPREVSREMEQLKTRLREIDASAMYSRVSG